MTDAQSIFKSYQAEEWISERIVKVDKRALIRWQKRPLKIFKTWEEVKPEIENVKKAYHNKTLNLGVEIIDSHGNHFEVSVINGFPKQESQSFKSAIRTEKFETVKQAQKRAAEIMENPITFLVGLSNEDNIVDWLKQVLYA